MDGSVGPWKSSHSEKVTFKDLVSWVVPDEWADAVTRYTSSRMLGGTHTSLKALLEAMPEISGDNIDKSVARERERLIDYRLSSQFRAISPILLRAAKGMMVDGDASLRPDPRELISAGLAKLVGDRLETNGTSGAEAIARVKDNCNRQQ